MLHSQEYQQYLIAGADSLVNSPAECQVKCQQVSACQFFSFKNGICYLKSRISYPANIAAVISGSKYCEGKKKIIYILFGTIIQ